MISSFGRELYGHCIGIEVCISAFLCLCADEDPVSYTMPHIKHLSAVFNSTDMPLIYAERQRKPNTSILIINLIIMCESYARLVFILLVSYYSIWWHSTCKKLYTNTHRVTKNTVEKSHKL